MMQNEVIHTGRVLIVEGKYDAARLAHLTDAMILLTDGFGIYKDKKRQQLFKALAQKNGLILLTDSDAAGFRIRNYITNLVGEKNVVQAYVPPFMARKSARSSPARKVCWGWKVWRMPSFCRLCGMPSGLTAGASTCPPGRSADHLHGPVRMGALRQAGQRRAQGKAVERTGLPPRLSKKELVEALNRLYTFEQLDEIQQAR